MCGYGRAVSVDDPGSYTTDRFDVLAQIGKALRLFESSDVEPFAFGDGPQAQAWLVFAGAYDQLGRALAWRRAEAALAARPDDAELKAAYDEAAELALHRDRPSPVLDDLRVMSPEQFEAAVPELVERIRAGSLREVVAVGRAGVPGAVLVPHELYRELVRAHMEWKVSPTLTASLDPAVHKPLEKSVPFNLEEFMSQDPVSREIWEQIRREKDGSA